MNLCITSFDLNCIMQLKQFYNIATKGTSRKSATTFGDLPHWWVKFAPRLINGTSDDENKQHCELNIYIYMIYIYIYNIYTEAKAWYEYWSYRKIIPISHIKFWLEHLQPRSYRRTCRRTHGHVDNTPPPPPLTHSTTTTTTPHHHQHPTTYHPYPKPTPTPPPNPIPTPPPSATTPHHPHPPHHPPTPTHCSLVILGAGFDG